MCIYIWKETGTELGTHLPPLPHLPPPQPEMPAPSLLEALLGRKGMVAVAELG